MALSHLYAVRRRLLQRARRLVTCPGEAEDLVQDALLAAHKAHRDFGEEATVRWLLGVLWRRAAFMHRTASRRRARERWYAARLAPPGEPPTQAALPDLPRSVRIVARLAAAGCSRHEIQWLLSLRPEALRQRISAARRRLRGTDPPLMVTSAVPGPVRTAVLPLSRRTGHLGTHDPDGHGFLVGCSRIRGVRQP